MAAYYLIIAVLIVLAIIVKKEKAQRRAVGIAFICIAAVIGFRSLQVGVDTINYYDEYKYIVRASWQQVLSSFYFGAIEVGYAILMKLCSEVYNSYFFFQIIYAILFSYFWHRIIREQKHWLFCILVFLGISIFLYSINIARQMLAVSMTAYTWLLFEKNRTKQGLLCFLLAITIHTTTTLFIAPIVLYFLPYNKWVYRLLPFGAIVMVSVFPLIIDYASVFMVKYVNYFDNHRTVQEANLSMVLWAIEVVLSIFIILNERDFNKNDKIAAIFSIMYVAFNVVGLQFNYFERLGLFYTPFLITVFVSLTKFFDRYKMSKVYLFCTGGCFLIYFIISAKSAQYNYSTFL